MMDETLQEHAPDKTEYVYFPQEKSPDGTLVGSELPTGHHLPIFDLDMDCRLIPSRSTGHFHLYLNKAISKYHYDRILDAMTDAGIVQIGWARHSEKGRDGQTFLRLPSDPSLLPEWAPKSRYKDPELEVKA